MNQKLLNDFANAIAERCLQTGLLVVHTGRESIKLAPPLCITKAALCEGVEVFREAIAASVAKPQAA